MRTLALDVLEFIRRFLQHGLPEGFMQVRYYGSMNPNAAIPHAWLAALIEMASGFATAPVPEVNPEPPPPLLCSHWGGCVVYRWTVRPSQRSS